MPQTRKKGKLIDVINLVLGVLLVYLFGSDPNPAVSWNAWLSGIAIAGLAIAALAVFAEWEEWINVFVGIWVMLSPWVVGFSANNTATWIHFVVGVIVAAAAAVRLWLAYQGPPRVTA